jgi:hypothetical protein
MEAHGRLRWHELADVLRIAPSCPKLHSYDRFHGCGYSEALSCSEPEHIGSCVLCRCTPAQWAAESGVYALHLFIREVCRRDLVGWIDEGLAEADDPSRPGRAFSAPAHLWPRGGVGALEPKKPLRKLHIGRQFRARGPRTAHVDGAARGRIELDEIRQAIQEGRHARSCARAQLRGQPRLWGRPPPTSPRPGTGRVNGGATEESDNAQDCTPRVCTSNHRSNEAAAPGPNAR